ncbi:MAG: Wzz/FepE/Etk N-terminal domain-containing protein [Pseudomonadota bacterium]
MKEEPTRPKTEETAPPCPPPDFPPGISGPPPHPWPPESGYGVYPELPAEEDEINLLDLFIVLLKHKVMIFSVVLLAGILAVVISLLMTNIYRSEITIAPTTQEARGGALSALGGFGAMIASDMGVGGTGSLDQFEVVLKSRDLTKGIVRKYNLLPTLFADSWDAANKRWKMGEPSVLQNLAQSLRGLLGVKPDKKKNENEPFTDEDAYKAMQDLLKVTPNKKQNVMQLSFEQKDPVLAQTILNYYVLGLSEFLRRHILEDAAAQQAQLSEQLAKTSDPLLKNRLYELIAKQIEKETLAKVQKYYSFNVIDPAYFPEMKFKPKRAQICLLSVVVAFFIAILLAFFLEYLQNMKKNEDPERLANLRNALRFRRRV